MMLEVGIVLAELRLRLMVHGRIGGRGIGEENRVVDGKLLVVLRIAEF